jgi:hypothetical protein
MVMTDNRQMAEPPDLLVGMMIVAALCCIGVAIYSMIAEGIIIWVSLFLSVSWLVGWLFRKWVEHD